MCRPTMVSGIFPATRRESNLHKSTDQSTRTASVPGVLNGLALRADASVGYVGR